jgi:hypothetical protein
MPGVAVGPQRRVFGKDEVTRILGSTPVIGGVAKRFGRWWLQGRCGSAEGGEERHSLKEERDHEEGVVMIFVTEN